MNNLDGNDHWLHEYYDGQDEPTEEEKEQDYTYREQLAEDKYEDSL